MATGAQQRLGSLDIFRGLTIAAMIVVNNPGSASEGARFAPLVHSPWHGCTPADLIFPFFVFICGATAVFSLNKKVTSGLGGLAVYKSICKRTLTLLGLGLFTWGLCGWLFQAVCPPAETQKSIWAILLSPPTDTAAYFSSLGNLRIPGVLQRLALVYCCVSILILHTRWQTQAAVASVLLLGYWGLMSLTGFSLQAGEDLGAHLDRAVFGPAHLYSETWDPEGGLSTLPAIATGILGALSGHWLLRVRESRHRVLGLMAGGAAALVLGWVWGLWFPLNKNLWTSSFVVHTAGYAMLLLGGLHWLIDLKESFWGCQPFAWLGRKPLWAYCGSQIGVLALCLLYIGTPAAHTSLLETIQTTLFGRQWDVLTQTHWADPRWPSLLWALLCLSFWIVLLGAAATHQNFWRRPWRPRLSRPAAGISLGLPSAVPAVGGKP